MSNRNWNDDENPLAGFGALISALGGGGDRGNMFPQSDAEDFAKGVRFVPGEVTMARRQGQKVEFVQNCNNSTCWYWHMPDGSKVYHWERHIWLSIAKQNGKWDGEGEFSGDAGACQLCGNVHTNGGTHKD